MEEEKVIKQLATVADPISGGNLISNMRVSELKIEDQTVRFSLLLPSLDSRAKSDLNFACIAAIQSVYPSATVHVHVVSQTPQAQQNSSSIPQVKNIIAVASGKGGVGKSTVSTNLALGLQKLGAKVGLLDADLYGPSIPTMLGLKGQRPKVQQLYGQNKIVPLMAYDMPVMSIGFIIEPEQAVVLRGPRLSGIIKQFINDCLWPELDYLVIDLPPGTGDIQLSLVQTVPITGVVLVTTPQAVALDDAIKAMNMFLLPSVNVPIVGVVENMSWFTPEELPNNKYYIFGEGGGKQLAKQAKTVLLGQVPLVQGIREAGDAGRPIVQAENSVVGAAFKQIAEQTARQLAIRNEMLAPTRIVNIKQ